MEFLEIEDEQSVAGGEYLLHEPSGHVVVCGPRGVRDQQIQAIGHGRIITDDVKNFRKLKLSVREHKEHRVSRCKGCSGG